jgi:hypothetical protein
MVVDPFELQACCIATQRGHNHGRPLDAAAGAKLAADGGPLLARMTAASPPREYFIQGLTQDGKTFRPSDWAERLAGAMCSFRPDTAGGIGAYIGYSPYCVPTLVDGVKAVIVNEALRELEPMAWDFVMNFARDNHLKVGEFSGRVAPLKP